MFIGMQHLSFCNSYSNYKGVVAQAYVKGVNFNKTSLSIKPEQGDTSCKN